MSLSSDPTVALLMKRGIRRGLLTLRRERGWGTSLWALLSVFLLIQLFLVVCLGVQGAGHLLRTQTNLRLQVRDGATDRGIQEFMIAAQSLPSISRAQYITREQAYERAREADPDLVQFLEQFNIQNPFPDIVAVTLRDLSYYDEFAAFMKQPQWQNIVDPGFLPQATEQERELRAMLRLTDAGQTLALLFLALAGGILLFVTMELVRRRAFFRRDEVFVEGMSGAREASLILPFATEAAVLLAIALALSIVILFFLLVLLPSLVPSFVSSSALGALRMEIGWRIAVYGPAIFILEFLLIPFIAFIGAFLGTRGGRGSLSA